MKTYHYFVSGAYNGGDEDVGFFQIGIEREEAITHIDQITKLRRELTEAMGKDVVILSFQLLRVAEE